ncbi:GPI alpha-1,6-mannosyltransferase 2 isoform X1 [Paroedura picta]|uniref:GPI alpha-1,6-mannosyltransferase 2 isoform X1 n=1 Tax=Paroedura picta TaxID=143630 RepID=UPI004056FF10
MQAVNGGDPHRREVVRFAALCRAGTLVLQALFNLLIPDHAADAFRPPRLSEPGLCDRLVEGLLGGLSRWDAEHFLFIAEHGYVYEHNCAFFPLFPLSLRATAGTVLRPLEGFLCFRSRLLLSAALLNAIFSVLASWVLYELGCVVLQCRRQAFLSAILFCITPANVFMAAAYSESMFALLAFAAMWQLEKGRLWTSTLLFSLTSGVRSNGMINAGFLIYAQTKHFASQLQRGTGVALLLTLGQLPTLAVSVALRCAFILLPFALFQFYAYFWFCSGNVGSEHVVPKPLLQLAVEMGYRLAFLDGKKPSWCSWNYPVVYVYIQDTYWNVGFLRYYEAKQIPNFLLAAPAVLLGSWAAWCYVSSNPWHCLTLGLARRETGNVMAESSAKPTVGFCSPGVFVYVVHSTALLLFGTFCMHIQVLTRFLGSSSPVLYWFLAHLLHTHEPLLQNRDPSTTCAAPHLDEPSLGSPFPAWNRNENPVLRLLKNWRQSTVLTQWILGYTLSYWLLGLALHCNFFPWT